MQLSIRLNKIAEKVNKCNILADIGTDHAYIPIFLLKSGIINRAIAADISSGSIDKANNNIIANNCSENIETRVGNGLTVIKANEKIDTIIMAGMGGMLSIEIMKASPNIVNNIDTLILQPQRDIVKVRRYLHTVGFKIDEEDMFKEDNKYYNIMVCHKGFEKYTDNEYLYGKLLIENKNIILKEYITSEMYKIKRVIDSILDKSELHIVKRREELLKEYESNKEILKCL